MKKTQLSNKKGTMKTFNKISNIKEYNQYVEKNYPNQIQLFFQKKDGYVFYGYNSFNTKRDFALWFKTKKQALSYYEKATINQ